MIRPHFKPKANPQISMSGRDICGGRLERFTDLLKDQQRLSALARSGVNVDTSIGIAIEERSAILISHDRLEVFGDEKSHDFLKMDRGQTIQWTELDPGEKLQLSTGPSQTIRLLKRPL